MSILDRGIFRKTYSCMVNRMFFHFYILYFCRYLEQYSCFTAQFILFSYVVIWIYSFLLLIRLLIMSATGQKLRRQRKRQNKKKREAEARGETRVHENDTGSVSANSSALPTTKNVESQDLKVSGNERAFVDPVTTTAGQGRPKDIQQETLSDTSPQNNISTSLQDFVDVSNTVDELHKLQKQAFDVTVKLKKDVDARAKAVLESSEFENVTYKEQYDKLLAENEENIQQVRHLKENEDAEKQKEEEAMLWKTKEKEITADNECLRKNLNDAQSKVQSLEIEVTKIQEDNAALKVKQRKDADIWKKREDTYVAAKEKIQTQLTELQKKNVDIQREHQGRLKEKDAQLHQSRCMVKELEQKDKKRTEEIDDQHRRICSLQEENSKLINNLSQMMNNKMSEDETCVENVSIKNRPLKLQETFELFCSEIWLDAKEALDDAVDDRLSEEEKHNILVMILKEAYDYAEKTLRKLRSNIYSCLKDPFSCVVETRNVLVQVKAPLGPRFVASEEMVYLNGQEESNTQDQYYQENGTSVDGQTDENKEKSTCEIERTDENTVHEELNVDSEDDELELVVNKFLKRNSENVKTEKASRFILDKTLDSIKEVKLNEDVTDTMLKYVSNSCEFAWKMCVQKPPMWFDNSGVGMPYNPELQEPQFGSDNPSWPDVKVAYYVSPALYHGDNLMKKGKVMLKK